LVAASRTADNRRKVLNVETRWGRLLKRVAEVFFLGFCFADHWQDVTVGSILGISIAYVAYRAYFRESSSGPKKYHLRTDNLMYPVFFFLQPPCLTLPLTSHSPPVTSLNPSDMDLAPIQRVTTRRLRGWCWMKQMGRRLLLGLVRIKGYGEVKEREMQ
jgi:hypothetical protein